jgi:peroxisomal 2,4-dienoyl-CoA reductase
LSTFAANLLRDRVALVTGGGTGLGRGIAEALLRHGCDVVVLGRRVELLTATADALSRATGRRCLAVPGDVREPEQLEHAVAVAVAQLGALDIVVNGAAGNFLAPAAELSYEAFRTVIEIDTLGTFNMCKAAYPVLERRGGSILNVSATLHYRGTAMQTHPVAAKAAIDALTRNLALEWGPVGIRVNAIAPGPIDDTEGLRRLLPARLRERLRTTIPLRRFGRTDDIASAALFLASEAASFITGAVLVVDGGSWMTLPSWDQLLS